MSKPKWNCETIKYIKAEINSQELKQRLAEVLLLLLNTKASSIVQLLFPKLILVKQPLWLTNKGVHNEY